MKQEEEIINVKDKIYSLIHSTFLQSGLIRIRQCYDDPHEHNDHIDKSTNIVNLCL